MDFINHGIVKPKSAKGFKPYLITFYVLQTKTPQGYFLHLKFNLFFSLQFQQKYYLCNPKTGRCGSSVGRAKD